jgi:hypothetical protein
VWQHLLHVAVHAPSTHGVCVSVCVCLQNPDTQPQAAIDPEVLAAAEAHKHSDSVRMMAGKLNEAVGGE